jgi:hypothetical protein
MRSYRWTDWAIIVCLMLTWTIGVVWYEDGRQLEQWEQANAE